MDNKLEDNSKTETNSENKYTSSNTKRIAKNTLMLYFRQILIMLVSLYTVRVVLNVLGAEDYGIYNVVAGVVILFSFVNNAMSSGTQRFLNFYLGKKDLDKTNQVYSSSLLIHFFISLIFVILAESVGLWFVNCKLNIPENRHSVAMIVYQFTILTTVFNILKVPYNAVIIAYERMSFFAGMSILEAVLKLGIVFLLSLTKFDKLIFYAFLLTCVAFITMLSYKIFCNRKFEIAHFKKVADKSFVKEQLAFSGWSLFGATANVANSQGTNIVLNIFTNVTVNAAMGVANQVNSAVYSFVSNFQMAFNPQIVKSWASKELEYFYLLLIRAAKVSYYLLFFIALPLYLNTDFVLSIWLKEVPNYAADFVRLTLIWSLIEAVNGPLFMAVQATGKIKFYQITIGIINLLNLPFVIIAFSAGANPLWLLYIKIALNIFALVFRVEFCVKYISLSRVKFIFGCIVPVAIISLLSFTVTFFIGHFFVGLQYFFVTCIVSILITGLLVFFIGLSKNERNAILLKMKGKIKK